MDPTSDHRFDSNFAIQLLMEIAHEQSLPQLLQKVVSRAVERPNMACVQVWLIDKGDLCSTCPRQSECASRSRCLHLVAGRATSPAKTSAAASRFDDLNARIPLGVGLLGQAAVTGRQIVVKDADERSFGMSGIDWRQHARFRGFGATPIKYQGEVLGIIVGLCHDEPPDEARPWGQIFADHIGAAIANARAFGEIQRLKDQLTRQNAYLQEEVVEAKAFGDLIGQSAALRQIVSQIDLVAPTEASVLILGETGTGKDLVAHEIHRRSRRKDGPLVRINCASIPRELFESEFFGHAQGAFTGAIKDRAGRFETAEGGTLFLDEIGELPLEIQGKLLRVLQEKHYERVGEDRTRPTDVRIIAATNRDLKKAVAAGRFREDLYYRLHVFPIQVTTLKERQNDIPLLAHHFVELSVKELRCPKPRLTRAGVAVLQNYDWPGNIRELRNVIERAVILARGGPLHFDLPATDSAPHSSPAQPASATPAAPRILTEAEMQHRERANILAALDQTAWKIKGPAGAAELLGLKPTTLLARMKKMALLKPARAADSPAFPSSRTAPIPVAEHC